MPALKVVPLSIYLNVLYLAEGATGTKCVEWRAKTLRPEKFLGKFFFRLDKGFAKPF